MSKNTFIDAIEDQEWLDAAGDAIQPAVLNAYAEAGTAGQKLKNFLHGTWLGHPLHPMLTDIPVGAWTAAAFMDILELSGNKQLSAGADASIGVGIAGALGAALSGLTDWTGTSQKRRKIGLMHGLLNLTATSLYATSLILRKQKVSRTTAIGLALTGYGITALAAYLGGHLVFREQTGVDHTATADEYPQNFVAVLPENDLKENTMRCVKADEVPVLLARQHGRIFALAHTCSHLGGPLSEGKLLDDAVKCPWHGSVFSLEDGSVIEGPATEPQPKFDVRIKDGQIEVRKRKN